MSHMQRILTPKPADVLEVTAWVRVFIDGLDEDKAKAWALRICQATADPLHGQPDTTAYTAQEAQDAIAAYGDRCDFPRRRELLAELKEQRRKNKRARRLKREASREMKALPSLTPGTRERTKRFIGELRMAIAAGDFEACERIASKASQRFRGARTADNARRAKQVLDAVSGDLEAFDHIADEAAGR